MSKLEYFQNMHTILLMEMKGLKLDEQLAVKANDYVAQDMRLALLMVESYEAKLASHCSSTSSDPQKEGKRQIVADLLEEQKQALAYKEAKAQEKDHHATECKRLVELKARMCEGVKVECDRLRYGRHSASFIPVPLVYPQSTFGEDESPERRFLKITKCALCDFRFPKSDIVIASCQHMYHSFCAKVTYVNGYKCAAPNCSDKLVDLGWHCSFGWRGLRSLVVEDVAARMMLCNEEVARLLTKRAERARLQCPNTDKYYACNFLVPVFCDVFTLYVRVYGNQTISTFSTTMTLI